MVRHGADGQGFRAKFCSDAVDTSRFHFHAEDAVFFHHVEHFAVRRVEQVSGEQVTNASINAQCFCRVYRVTHHVEVSDSGKVMVFKTDAVNFGIGAGTHTDNDVTQFYVRQNSTTGTYADNFLHAEIGDQFFGVDGAGRDTHTVTHYGNFAAFISTGEAQHTANVVHFTGIFKESFSNILRTQRVAWHQNYVSKIAHFCINVWSSHRFILFVTY
ncbi:hypothetical protein HmCmsJML147_03480 [Escherichia coli]|nr:hypothetical protein HmCmsJML147_03480 [Escherichia coli]